MYLFFTSPSAPLQSRYKHYTDEFIFVYKDIASQIRKTFADEDSLDFVEEEIFPKYGWESVQEALLSILLDDTLSDSDYQNVADIFWSAALNGSKIKKETTIGLLYYRFGDINAPYENNTLWSLVCEVYGLDYCNSEYNPLKDEKIIAKLTELGLSV